MDLCKSSLILNVCACIYANAHYIMGKQYTVKQQCMVKGTWNMHLQQGFIAKSGIAGFGISAQMPMHLPESITCNMFFAGGA